MVTFAANACAGTSGSQTQMPTNSGSVVLLTSRRSPMARTTPRPPAISRKGALAAQTNHQRGAFMWSSRAHSLIARRVASARSRARRSPWR
jgi:hypothetical protein